MTKIKGTAKSACGGGSFKMLVGLGGSGSRVEFKGGKVEGSKFVVDKGEAEMEERPIV